MSQLVRHDEPCGLSALRRSYATTEGWRWMRRPSESRPQGVAARLGLFGEVQSFESSPNPFVGICIAFNHERRGGFGCLVRVACIERWRRVVLDTELDSLRDLRSSKFGDDAECEINSRG